jgi:hypothetical protein
MRQNFFVCQVTVLTLCISTTRKTMTKRSNVNYDLAPLMSMKKVKMKVAWEVSATVDRKELNQ